MKQNKQRAIRLEAIEKLNESFNNDPLALQSQNAVVNNGLNAVSYNNKIKARLTQEVSHRLDDWKVTSQGSSGRCWLFAATNLLRSNAREKFNLVDFQFSQTYLYFWDKLERVNYFLEDVEATYEVPAESQLFEHMMSSVMADGGQWVMAENLVNKYGVVPLDVMPETYPSSNTAEMCKALQAFLRFSAKELREMKRTNTPQVDIDEFKNDILARAHRILSIHLGTPPTTFSWQWRDKDGNFQKQEEITPQDFFKKVVDLPISDYVCLVDDPRREHPKKTPLVIEHLGNIWGAEPTTYMNADIELMKTLTKESILRGEPVWFGCAVRAFMDRVGGFWANELFRYQDLYNFDFNLTKEDRVVYQQSYMTHAMLFTGVDIAEDGSTTRWRVENSWGDKVGKKGFFIMDDSWFSDYVFEVAVRKSELPKEYQQAFNKEPILLPAWDPMGSLAG
jgi:bleomycin hydrolase